MHTKLTVAIVGLAGLVAALAAQAPVTPADYPARMKSIATANGALQKKLKSGQVADAAADAKTLAELFGQIEQFWTKYKRADAVTLAQQAREGFAAAAAAASGGDAATVQTAAGNALATCKQCHAAYREGTPQEGFRFKAGALDP